MSAIPGEYPVRWYEGMLLTAQHFYAQDAYWQQRLRRQARQLGPYGWGVIELEIDESRLFKGYFAVTRLHAVTPGGDHIFFPLPDDPEGRKPPASVPPKPRTELLGIDLKEVLKYRSNVVVRVTSRPEEHSTEYGGLGVFPIDKEPPPIEYLKPRLSLQEGSPVEDDSIALAGIVRDLNGGYALSTFHGPMLRLSASSFLGPRSVSERLGEMAVEIRRKATRLAERLGATSPAVASLMSALPLLEVLLDSNEAHPFEVYKALSLLMGHTAGMFPRQIPQKMMPYDHGDMYPGFEVVLSSLEILLEWLSPDFEIFEFAKREARFGIAIHPHWEQSRWVIEIRPAAGQSLSEVAAWLREAKIGSASLLELLHRRRSPGAQVTLASEELVRQYTLRGGAMFFVLHNTPLGREDERVLMIRPGEELVIDGPEEGKPPARVLLYRDVGGDP